MNQMPFASACTRSPSAERSRLKAPEPALRRSVSHRRHLNIESPDSARGDVLVLGGSLARLPRLERGTLLATPGHTPGQVQVTREAWAHSCWGGIPIDGDVATEARIFLSL